MPSAEMVDSPFKGGTELRMQPPTIAIRGLQSVIKLLR